MTHRCEAILRNGRGIQCPQQACWQTSSTVKSAEGQWNTVTVYFCAEHDKIHNRRLKSGRTCSTTQGLLAKPKKASFYVNMQMPVLREPEPHETGPFAFTMSINFGVPKDATQL